jgi:alpha-galactosidase
MRLSAVLILAGSALFAAPASAEGLEPTGAWTAYAAGQAALPPMGWNSWNAFYHDVDEEKVLASAQVIVDSGLAAKGYRYINIDDGWWLKRSVPDGRMVVRTATFPSAAVADGSTSLRPLTERLHAMGLKAGIYSDIGRNSCGQTFGHGAANNPQGSQAEREVGLYDHIDRDIALYFREWGFDYIKVDGCGIRGMGEDNANVAAGIYRAFLPLIDFDSPAASDIRTVRGLYEEVGEALARHNPDGDFVFSICLWGSADVRSWAHEVGNLSRTSEDIGPQWGRMLHNLDSAARRELYAQPGSWNDPDMLFVGTGDFAAGHLTEARSHFALWAMLNAPLIIGYDLRQATPELLAILGNSEIIALNQDPAGHQAVLAFDTDDLQIFVKTLADGSKAVALFNRTGAPLQATLTADQLKFAADAPVALVDLWSRAPASFTGETDFALAPHETRVFRATGTRRLAGGMYLSELPGSINVAEDGIDHPIPDPSVHRAIISWQGSRGRGEAPRYAGWGGARADATPYGQPLRVAASRFASGIGILANSRLEVRNAGFGRFAAQVGIDRSAPADAPRVQFELYGDGERLATSGWLALGDPAHQLTADVRGRRILELVVRSEAPADAPVPVAWGNAALTH